MVFHFNYISDTYFRAKASIRKNRKEPKMVELQDEEEEQECRRRMERETRKRKRPAFLENYSTETDGEEEDRSTVPDNVSEEGGISVPEPMVIKVEPMEDTASLESFNQRRQDTTDNSRNISKSNHLQGCLPNIPQSVQHMLTKCPCNSSCHKMILQSLATMQKQVEDNSRMLQQIMGQLMSNSRSSVSALNTLMPVAPANLPVTLPMRELSDLQIFDYYLSDQYKFTEAVSVFSNVDYVYKYSLIELMQEARCLQNFFY